ncbi:SRPBCC family protein [Nitratireductor sp. ZSWI3]|uniref:SRPBCC family protein n=1 Tax=Nitratireductor sp. ZSWI3 TaxID=2966359 RepID=UPI00214F94AF|nr:SRPBCC family protein [Nitratireductor sp. ZSWI3]MCR4265933.1 SRPBCC family protein [Nitratireductor sp. ZSWI3]
MLRMRSSVCIEAPAVRVWQCLSAIENIDYWVPAINRAYCETDQKAGVGAVRICHLDKFDVREEFLEWEEGRSFKYRGVGAPMMAWATNRWRVEPVGDKTLVTSDVEMMVKGGVLGRLLEPIIYLALRLGLPNGLAPLKYYVETGEPFNGDPRRLPLADAIC